MGKVDERGCERSARTAISARDQNLPPPSGDVEKTPAYVVNAGQRVVSMYMHGQLDLSQDSLVAQFFARADEKTRAHILLNVPFFMKQAEDDEQRAAMRDRAIAFWEWRLATSTDADLRGFGGWLDANDLEEAWRLEQLETVLRRVGDVDMDFRSPRRWAASRRRSLQKRSAAPGL